MSTKAKVEAVEEIVTEEPKRVNKPQRNKKGVVSNCQLLNVRDKANKDSKVLEVIPEGFEVNILGEEKNFYKTSKGYVMKDFIKVI